MDVGWGRNALCQLRLQLLKACNVVKPILRTTLQHQRPVRCSRSSILLHWHHELTFMIPNELNLNWIEALEYSPFYFYSRILYVTLCQNLTQIAGGSIQRTSSYIWSSITVLLSLRLWSAIPLVPQSMTFMILYHFLFFFLSGILFFTKHYSPWWLPSSQLCQKNSWFWSVNTTNWKHNKSIWQKNTITIL